MGAGIGKAVSSRKQFYDHMEDYVEGNDFSECTKRAYRIAISRFLNDTEPWKKSGWVKRAVQWRSTLGMATSSQHLYIVAARRYLGECHDKKMVSENPLNKIKVKVEAYSSSRRMLTDEEVDLLLKTVSGGGVLDARNKAVLTLMLYTGLRIGSVAKIKVGDFDIRSKGKIVVLRYQSKGHRTKDLTVVAGTVVLNAIRKYMSLTDRKFGKSKGPLFISIEGKQITVHGLRKMITRSFEKAGIREDGICAHSLRHTAATKAIKAGQSLLAVRDMLGHKSVQTTEIYIHSIRRIEEAAELQINYETEKKSKKKKSKKKR